MKQEGLAFFTDTWLTVIGLLIFFSYFTYTVVRVCHLKKEYYETMSKMPLEDLNHER